jgi:AcrR family transcriptional regulator
MRTKSESRRQAILQAAAEVFQDKGFERTSMSDIRERVGCSKPTLYSYFASKEALFSDVVFSATEQEFQETLQALDPDLDNLNEALQSFGRRLLTLLYSPQVQAVRRMLASQAVQTGLGRRCYEMGPLRSEAAIAAFLEAAMDEGRMRQADPRTAALHLKALLEAEWIEPFLFDALPVPTAAQIESVVARGVVVFMAAYGPTPKE